ncbi:hypothetical protein Acr_23g0006130 [Actinidia rufa]|uniref:Uncharacterized protein n=1 Tax=Actinidia rufa TaxID=165716 RepID=A0A7J0GNA8_9ERIC|nr:hypothetical protein Acr_23g0006130 [Actinidia rufa]
MPEPLYFSFRFPLYIFFFLQDFRWERHIRHELPLLSTPTYAPPAGCSSRRILIDTILAKDKVAVAVIDSEIDQTNGLITRFGGAMNDGFVLDWRTVAGVRRRKSGVGITT